MTSSPYEIQLGVIVASYRRRNLLLRLVRL
jgi:hypothetical protein